MNRMLNQVFKPKKTFREAPSELLNRFPFARWTPLPLRLVVGYAGPPGYECNLLYLACLAALVLSGSGPLAIDGLIRKRSKVEHS